VIRKADIITTEVIGCYLLSIAEEVGIAMIKAAFSPNIKERRDCSAALLDKNGGVIAQASHIPMHLGSLFGAAETILNKYSVKNIEEGDVFIVNDGYVGGGTHLPDINIVTPIFYENQLMAFAGNIGHHLDVGGRVPGSTIASSQSIFEEGIRIPPVKILKKGVFQDDLMDLITLNTRDPIERTMDLEVQIMANEIAKPRMKELIERYGPKTILDAIDALNNYSERRMKSIIKYLEDGEYEFTSILDDDGSGNEAQIRVRITVDGKNLDINFSGTSPQSPGALNVTRSALLSTVY
jgi:N-methylhydantoinase B